MEGARVVGLRAQRARAEPGAGPVGRRDVERGADDGDIGTALAQLGLGRKPRPAAERREPGEALPVRIAVRGLACRVRRDRAVRRLVRHVRSLLALDPGNLVLCCAGSTLLSMSRPAESGLPAAPGAAVASQAARAAGPVPPPAPVPPPLPTGAPAAGGPSVVPVTRRWSRRARLGGYLGVAAAAVAGSTMVYLVDPAEPGHYPTCPFKWATGGLDWDCPGCGSMRGLHQVLHGHLGAAADYNLFFVIAAPLLLLGGFVAVGRLLGLPIGTPRVPVVFYRVLPVLVVAYWIVRNTPGPVGGWLHS